MTTIDHGNGIVEVKKLDVLVNEPSDILDIYTATQAKTLILFRESLDPAFFKLATGFAGEMLQKVSNYNKKLAILGDYSDIKSKPMKDFIYESNKTRQVLFVSSAEEAIRMFT